MDGRDGEDRNNQPDASNEAKMEIANAYEKSVSHLYNMYCRQIFWSLIQKDDMAMLFDVLFTNEQDMKSFACFLKVMGNESYITESKR